LHSDNTHNDGFVLISGPLMELLKLRFLFL